MRPQVGIAFVLAIAFALSGCTLLQAATPEEQVSQAVERFREGMGPDGDVNRMSGDADVEGMRAELEIEFGANNALRVSMDAAMFSVVMTCVDGATFLELLGDTYESRSTGEECTLDFDDEGPEVPFAEESDDEIVEVTTLPDGALEATIRTMDDGEEQLITVVVRNGRLVEMTMEDDEGTMTLTVEYGDRRTISPPSATSRMPASVSWDVEFAPGTYTGTVMEVDAELPLAEFSVQVLESSGVDEPLVSFPLSAPGAQSEGGFTAMFEDNGDGLLSAGDRFTISNPDWESEFEYHVALFDGWAGMRTDENPVPGLGALWLLLALVAFVGVALRRRRGREE